MLLANRYFGNAIQGACLVMVVLACGCQTGPQSQFGNPFLSADRVPPPATRTIAPGAAQPYYPGDPVPAMQGSYQPQGAPPLAAIPAAMPPTVLPTITPTASYGPTQPVAQPIAQPQFVPIAPLQTGPLQTGGVPTTQPVGSNPPAFPATNGVADTGFTNPASPAAATSRPPLGGAGLAGGGVPQNGINSPNAWRSPGVQGFNPAPAQPGFGAQPIATSPRIRMPQAGVPGAVQPASYVAAVPGVPQTVGVTPLPPRQPQASVTYQQPPVYNSGWQVPPRR